MFYDVIVVGAGHAGSEAASAAGKMGSKVLLITMDMTKIAQMSCNPAMGGIAKGQIVREIDALGGFSGIVTDQSMIQFRMLNRSKGPAMWSPRAQCDRALFTQEWRKVLEENRNIDFWQDLVYELIIENNVVTGVKTRIGVEFKGKCVILTNGTFENGLIHIGRQRMVGGRISEPRSEGISKQLNDLDFEVGRLKTGTPARIDGRSVDFSILEEQGGDEEGGSFSYMHDSKIKTNFSCFVTYTNPKVHSILQEGFKDSPLYNGTIQGRGPRYCPSIEDKIVTFSDKLKHQLFLEPEGKNTNEYYINGFSSSLPWDIQLRALREVKGLENVKIFRPGYAIEYDYYPPTQLNYNLETKKIKNLFFAGQINGTTGYEEAAGQGILAGINAHIRAHGNGEFILKRDESYIGVLIDDLVSKGVDEPYRMFTSRAEYRILLRQDNCDERLTEKSFKIGLADKKRYENLLNKISDKNLIIDFITNYSISPIDINGFLDSKETSRINQKTKLIDIVRRPQISLKSMYNTISEFKAYVDNVKTDIDNLLERTEIEIKYEGYIEREKLIAEKIQRLDSIKIHENVNYDELKSISLEGRQKLKAINPKTIGQASRISGVSPSDINVLLVHIGR
jgi:tRNA uridine 5-carboxymethylaminomethyl modification enzyme